MKQLQLFVTLISILLVYSSCSFKAKDKVINNTALEAAAIKCILEKELKNSNNPKGYKKYVYNRMKYFDHEKYIGTTSENCKFCKGAINEEFLVEELPKIDIPYEVVLEDTFISNKSETYYRFSPLISTTEKGVYSVVVEQSDFSETVVVMYLLKENQDQGLDYVLRLNSFLAHH